MKNKSLTPRILLALTALAAICITVLINGILLVLANRNNLAIDLTRSAAYQLDQESLLLLEGLEAPVSIKVLAAPESFEGNPYLVQARSILEQYPKHSDQVSLEYIDYTRNPAFAADYPSLSLKPGNILISSGDSLRQLSLNELFNYTYSAGTSSGTSVASSRAQEAISSAILQVTSGRPLKAAMLTGADTAQQPALQSLLKDNNIQLSQINLTSEDYSEYDLLILLCPMVDLSLESLEKIDAFLYNQGNYRKTLLYTMDASQPHLPNLAAYLAEWGVKPLDGAVFETSANLTYRMQPYYPLVEYTDQAMSAKLRDSSIPMLLPRAKPFQLLFASRDYQHTSTLVSFSPTSGVRPSQAGSDFDPGKAKLRGPLPAMAVLTRKPRSQEPAGSAILISASTAMLEESALGNAQLANTDYLLNLLNHFTGREQGITIRPVSLAGAYLGLNSGTARLLGILLLAVLPGIILLAGLSVFLYRRFQ